MVEPDPPAGKRNSNNNHRTSTAYVLYVDHQGHPAPLDECYHATASRRLSSSILNRGHPSTINTVDSAYCPQCLTVYTEFGPGSTSSSGSNSGGGGGFYCTKPTCKVCPICFSIVSIRITNPTLPATVGSNNNGSIVVYQCSCCNWTSEECNVYTSIGGGDIVSSSLSSEEAVEPMMIGRVEMTRAANEIQNEFVQLKRTKNDIYEQYWVQLTTGWSEELRNTNPRNTISSFLRSSPSRSSRLRNRSSSGERNNSSYRSSRTTPQEDTVWSIETLENQLLEKKNKLLYPKKLAVTTIDNIATKPKNDPSDSTVVQRKGLQIQRIPIKSYLDDNESDTVENDKILADIPFLSYHQQATNVPFVNSASIRSTLLPLLIPLRLRTSRRCRMELSEGRPGILIKPKLNPLEGDSSLRTGQGQWYKKDCSAIAIIPRIDIIQHHTVLATDNQQPVVVFLLKVSNPTLGTVRLRFTSSTYTGEPQLFNDDGNSTTTTTTDLPDLVVETVYTVSTPIIVDATVHPIENVPTSETVELLSAEDSIIELGAARAREIPVQVLEWKKKYSSTTTSVVISTRTTQIKLVAQSASDAWFEVAIVAAASKKNNNNNKCHAFPLALQVDLGNGSWESSLIPPDTSRPNDYVTFDIVLVHVE